MVTVVHKLHDNSRWLLPEFNKFIYKEYFSVGGTVRKHVGDFHNKVRIIGAKHRNVLRIKAFIIWE